ncbi:peptidoglycan editing factor PgeF [Motiliproteus sp. SC1-56]|uniref:peptidoglycan editing factor PgeF n=1 Tax=Motiliproteus sp. SC1-56 TaxID=2799565 RepID=UPI001A9066E2|nr:peptidoglycan editing factor PgeF [Motiliproteus sp. SC1-56]
MLREADLIIPQWPAPSRVRARVTTRAGGVSESPFDTLNLGGHVGDAPSAVAENRRYLQSLLGDSVCCHWMEQVHGTGVFRCDGQDPARVAEADAAVATEPYRACLVMTADCLPVLFAARDGSAVGAAHAGWRGLANGVLEAALASLPVKASEVLCWLGPAIGPAHFEVGEEVREAFTTIDPAATHCFLPGQAPGKWLADLYALARLRLGRAGVTGVYGGDFCTYAERRRFYSYRRDGRTGRMASLIWLADEA